MTTWAGVALALRTPEQDAMQSRLVTHLHPLAGRVLAWHGLRAMASADPAPRQIFLASRIPMDRTVAGELTVTTIRADEGGWHPALLDRLAPEVERLLVIDAAAATLDRSVHALVHGDAPAVLRTPAGEPVAAWIERAALEAAGAGARLEDLAEGLPSARAEAEEELLVVRDRMGYARALGVIRDRVVRRLMQSGVTFLQPETVLVDVDVSIGRDSVVYPGAVLEGQTSIGAETVVGPGCRIVDARVGSGVELKGWNYIVGSHIRNRAVLEPYVRRGFD